MEGERDDDLGFQDQVASWEWVEALDPDMESWIQTLGDSSHFGVEVVVPTATDMVVAAVDETVSAAVQENQVLAPAVKREEEAEAQGLMREGGEEVLVVRAEQVELSHGKDAQVDAPVQQDGEGAQVVAPVHGADADHAEGTPDGSCCPAAT
jgi:hypothetical protein